MSDRIIISFEADCPTCLKKGRIYEKKEGKRITSKICPSCWGVGKIDLAERILSLEKRILEIETRLP